MTGVLLAELRKTVRRPAVWICLGILVAVLVGIGYLIVWFVYSHPTAQMRASLPRGIDIKELLRQLYPPSFHRQTLSFASTLGGAIALVLGVLTVGSEYGWNTLKTLFTQRPGRLQVMVAKLMALALVLLVFTLAAFLADAAVSFLLASIDGGSTAFPAPDVIGKAVLAAWLDLAMWGLMGAFLAFAFRQSALAIGLGLVYQLVIESLIFGTLGTVEFIRNLEKWFPGPNATALTQAFGRARVVANPAPPITDGTHAAVVLLVYCAVFIAASAVFLRARDVS